MHCTRVLALTHPHIARLIAIQIENALPSFLNTPLLLSVGIEFHVVSSSDKQFFWTGKITRLKEVEQFGPNEMP